MKNLFFTIILIFSSFTLFYSCNCETDFDDMGDYIPPKTRPKVECLDSIQSETVPHTER